MDIFTTNKKLKAALQNESVCIKQYGLNMTKKLLLRVTELRGAETLAAFWPPNSRPERGHELKGNRRGTFSVDLNQPYRLLFTLIEDQESNDRRDERKRWAATTAIELIGIEDTHG